MLFSKVEGLSWPTLFDKGSDQKKYNNEVTFCKRCVRFTKKTIKKSILSLMNVIFTEFLMNFFIYCLKCERNIKSQIYPTGKSKCSIYQLWLLDEINIEAALDNLGFRIHLLIADYRLLIK